MKPLSFSDLTLATLARLTQFEEQEQDRAFWEALAEPLTEKEIAETQVLQERLRRLPIMPLNEATLWARAIYPLLMLAETSRIIAWSEVSIGAQWETFALEGVVDGTLAAGPLGAAEAPYLVVMEAKRGFEGKNPQPQLFGQLLVAATINQKTEAFGAYTVADIWTFVRAEIVLSAGAPTTLRVMLSPEYAERSEAGQILKILKGIVAKQVAVE